MVLETKVAHTETAQHPSILLSIYPSICFIHSIKRVWMILLNYLV